jgi:predicted DNA-binding protein
MKRINNFPLRLSPELRRALEAACAKAGQTLSTFIRRAIEAALKR